MSESEAWVLSERDAGLAIVTLNRPERLNALSAPVMDRLVLLLREAAEDGKVRALLLRGAGRAFCAGGDLKSGGAGSERAAGMTTEERVHALRRQMDSTRLLHTMPKPTVSALRGAVMGAGVGLGLAADFRIASETLSLNTTFASLGFSGDFGGSYMLSFWAGASVARELMLRPRKLGADEALRLGLVNRVVADGVLDAEAMQLARELAQGPSIAYEHMKRALNAAADGTSLEEVLDLEAAAMVLTGSTQDHKEAVKAFVEKREPKFSGR